MNEREEARDCVNIIIEYCDIQANCKNCGIREFCTDVRKFGMRFSDSVGYLEEDD